MPRVSVIIPAFNAEEYIEQALRSVLGQTSDDWEIVVCDDCSTDATAERVRSLGDRITLVRTETNSGPAVARNLAIAHSSGELLAFLDSDDYWLPVYLERQVALYDSANAANGDVGIVACNASLLRNNDKRPETHMDVVRFPRNVGLRRLLRSNPIFGSALAPRRAASSRRSVASAPTCPAPRTSTSGSGSSRPATGWWRRARCSPCIASARRRGRATWE